MQLSKRVKVTAYLVMGVYSLILAIVGIKLDSASSRIIGFIPLGVIVVWWIFDNWLWRLKWILPFVQRPYLAGTWHGELHSYRFDDDGKPLESSHEVVLTIRQNYTDISVTLLSAESKSRSAAADIRRQQSDDYALMYQYLNSPTMRFRDRSPIHTGGATIEVGGHSPIALDGEYWTARQSRGTFSVKFVTRSVVRSFPEGSSQAKAAGVS